MTLNLVDPELDLTDPNPDIYEHFNRYNSLLFYNKLGCCEVKWSKRMTLCAGNCRYKPRNGECVISLSEPLLKLRPRSDFINTLLHEMIHAYLFVTKNNRDRDGHGPEFQSWMNKLNRICGTSITIYHTFNQEVRHYKTHVWRCNGSCASRPPFWGYVRRSMNRAPSKNDYWWLQHEMSCGGKFVKIKEPENYKKKVTIKNDLSRNGTPNRMTVINGILVSGDKSKLTTSPLNKGKIITGSKNTNNGNKTLFPKDVSNLPNKTIEKRKDTKSKEQIVIKKPTTPSNIKLSSGKQTSIDKFVTRTPKTKDISKQGSTNSFTKSDNDIIYIGTSSKGVKLGSNLSKSPSLLKKLHQERLERMKKKL